MKVLIAWLASSLLWSTAAAAAAAAAGAPGVRPSGDPGPAFESARWIAPPTDAKDTALPLPIFRKEFVVTTQPTRAVLRIVGLGDYDARINGTRITATGINQPWSQYERTIYYRDFDVTTLLRPGTNCVGVMLANSFWNNPHPPQGRYNKEGTQRITVAFQGRFLDPATRRLRHSGSPQCANAMALAADLVPPELREALVDEIIEDLEKRGGQQTPGDVGHVHFIRALAEAGRSDVLHRVYSREHQGSYGGILAKGLTALPETWDATMDGYQSLNHCMLGHAMEWFYGYVAGIRQPAGGTGWERALIAPVPGALTSAEATVRTPRGPIATRWRRDGTRFRLEATIPPGVEAEAWMPSGKRHPLPVGTHVLEED